MLSNIRRSFANYIDPQRQQLDKFVSAFFGKHSGQWSTYDADRITYIEKGLLYNPDVYAVINKMSTKAASIPYKVTDGEENEEKDFPLERPNPLQSWGEVKALMKMFLRSTGNVFIYMPSPIDGRDAGTPLAFWVLPSHLMKIVTRKDANLMEVFETPVEKYMLIEGQTYVEFEESNVIHIKYPNVEYDLNGSQLYGMSPLRPLLRNIETSNEAIDNNLRTLKNAGAFGLLHAMGDKVLTKEQAGQLKERLVEMDSGSERLSKIAGVSTQVGFTRISLTTDELKPFEFLKFDQKQVCNVLDWSDKLMNNDDGAKYDNIKEVRKMVLTDNIMPDNVIINEALTEKFIRRFKGYETATLESFYDNLPELQEDVAEKTKRLDNQLDRGVISRNEYRKELGMEEVASPEMDTLTVKDDVIPLNEAVFEETIPNGGQED